GSSSSRPAPSKDVVNPMGIGGTHHKEDKTYHAGFKRPGMDLISADKDGGKKIDPKDVVTPYAGPNPAVAPLNGPRLVKRVTGDEQDLMRGADAAKNPEKRLDKIFEASNDNKYVNPDAPEGTQAPVVTPEMLEKAKVRLGANKDPVPAEY